MKKVKSPLIHPKLKRRRTSMFNASITCQITRWLQRDSCKREYRYHLESISRKSWRTMTSSRCLIPFWATFASLSRAASLLWTLKTQKLFGIRSFNSSLRSNQPVSEKGACPRRHYDSQFGSSLFLSTLKHFWCYTSNIKYNKRGATLVGKERYHIYNLKPRNTPDMASSITQPLISLLLSASILSEVSWFEGWCSLCI